MSKKIIVFAAVFGMLAVIFGAFGAHGLKELLSVEQLSSFETGVKYQMYHALMLLFVGMSQQVSDKSKKVILYLVTAGIVLFSGSIYLLSTREILGVDVRSIGFITPIGGLLFISAWAILLASALAKNHKIDKN
ncbi:MAG TPA: DUF423 domain-containing protein [Flavobacterium sp.]|jgi:uncharacterized membrane protein YgdD (TMEM256/DUF423 family)